MISQVDIAATIAPLFMTAYLETMFSAIISLKGLSKSDFDGENKSDLFAAIFLILSLIILIALPTMLAFVV